LLDNEISIYRRFRTINIQQPQSTIKLYQPLGVTTSGNIAQVFTKLIKLRKINPITGLTETQTALLSPEEQIIQQRLNTNKPITLVG
jgi:hypothetical protein